MKHVICENITLARKKEEGLTLLSSSRDRNRNLWYAVVFAFMVCHKVSLR